jgi:lipopolysaccharide/colanic/teichoic acid biosynthesis glycosyltransferase
MLLTALAIRLESPGPVIYRQERVGQGGRLFTVLKFRSMAEDAEKDGKPRWAQTNDPRVTRVGGFIRKTRIDELPQLLNVVRGDMSFVGPRPERPKFVEELSKSIPYYGVRHSVKPGVTGWAQVRLAYGASLEDAVRKLENDLYYVKNHSLFLDLLILLETVRVVLFREGAR